MENHLKDQTSPYLLQHADNPVDWYPWCQEAFVRARKEDKPIFLSIGYSTCHWCHVMAHESFEDTEIAEILNKHFISIKVDKEERPDIDSIYMSVCQSLTGSGGWPTTIFLTPEQKPFYAGTYFPKTSGYGRIGLKELLLTVCETWKTDREMVLRSADEILGIVNERAGGRSGDVYGSGTKEILSSGLMADAFTLYKRTFDEKYGGFGRAPKFPAPHNLLFLLQYYEKNKEEKALKMVEKTLLQMYRGGMFDHIGGGFSRYSTDRYFLVPHFEKMLYDNALLIMAYCKVYQMTRKDLYRQVAERTADYILREMTSPEGGFYSAQDADSEGVEGKYYLLEPEEIIAILGEEVGEELNRYFDITDEGNFEGKNIPNLLQNKDMNKDFNMQLQAIYAYRKKRYALHPDDKILTGWNGLMIAAMCHLYRVTGEQNYLDAAVKAQKFIEENLCEKHMLYVSYRKGQRGGRGFLDDYANEAFALLALYGATLDTGYLKKAGDFCAKAVADFYDEERGGFFLYGKENEQLILRPKETYDGAVFSGNSAMAYNLVQMFLLTGEKRYEEWAERQLQYMSREAAEYPAGHTMFLIALSDYIDMPTKITVVCKDKENLTDLPCKLPIGTILCVLEGPTEAYPLKNDRITYYVCKGCACLPPVNDLNME